MSQYFVVLPVVQVFIALIVGLLWSIALQARGKAAKVKWWQQHTTPMFLLFGISLVLRLVCFWDQLQSPVDEQDQLFSKSSLTNTSKKLACMKSWETNQALDVYGHSPWIADLASTLPIFVVITFVVTTYSVLSHAVHAKEYHLWAQKNRFMTLWIVQLPFVYTLSAMFGVQEGLRQARIGAYQCFTEEAHSAFFIESSLSFGDGYEAIALLFFAHITMNLIEHTVDKKVLNAEKSRAHLSAMDAALPSDHPLKLGKDFHILAEKSSKMMLKLEQMNEKLVHATWSLSTLGITYFCITCLCVAIPQTLACQFFAWNWTYGFETLYSFSQSWAVTFKGMGLLGSCVAIHNMVSIEGNFEHPFLKGYEATAKFISVKIMVSIIFLQELILPVAFGLTPERAVLFDATLRIIELCFISIFNLKAWPLEQNFYEMEAMELGNSAEGKSLEDLTESLLERGKTAQLEL